MPRAQRECPVCLKKSSSRTRGRCRKCGAIVFPYDLKNGKTVTKVWVTEKPSCKNLVEYLQQKIRDFRSDKEGDFVFQDYESNLYAASQLLKKVEGNAELAYLIIDQFYPPRTERGNRQHQPPGISRRPRSMRGIIWTRGDENEQFALALMYARTALRERHEGQLKPMRMEFG